VTAKAWILLDTETTGFTAPVFVVELAAQRMCGWQPDGKPFRRLLNQNAEIPAEASRVHGYTREILERDGEAPLQVYREFAEYCGNLPLVSFNLEYDLDEVLKPEWKRLRISPIGGHGLCALRLAQRLLDPIPAGNCKLQTLRQYYRLPERGAHTAFEDVQTVADLFATVLRPIAEKRGLNTWDELVAYAEEEWFPSRLAFGKHKGRLFQEARKDLELRGWIEWLASSSNLRSARMGRWYLRQLAAVVPHEDGAVVAATRSKDGIKAEEVTAIVIYVNPALEELRQLVAGARARLAELEADYTKEKARVDAVRAFLFVRLREHYEKRDQLRLVIDYRKQYLDSLLRGDDEEAEQVEENYERAKTQTNQEYDETAAAVSAKKALTADDEAELTRLWKKLVKLYHPDRFAHEPEKLETYHKLTSAINRAKDSGDIETLREIAEDPHGYILRHGWANLDFGDESELNQLRRLHETLQLEIITIIESLTDLKESPDYELYLLSEQRSAVLDELVTERKKMLEKESAQLETQASRLGEEIKELTGEGALGVL
jgi:DNA polymerase III epsilon subunit-like protein